ncbi:MAG: DNA topoisomerase III [Ruminococcaceae bacterium]|nr:DNA topoisomerase III [Oscillospiraceae bacterium]
MILIIAEKPSLARNIAGAIGNSNKKNGYLECGEYLITWAFGHLFSLCDIEEYTPGTEGQRWTMDNLPCFPEEFKFRIRSGADKKPDAGVERQFGVIRALCRRSDVTTIVNAGDSDREGEIIVRLCVDNAMRDAEKKPVCRLWLPDQTPQTIKAAIEEMRSDSEYDNLANEGFARTYIDWLYGVNLTRYATLKTGSLLRVGRVIVPIVKAIYDRDMAIRNFVPEKYFVIRSCEKTNGEDVELVSKEKFAGDKLGEAQAACDRYNAETAVVTSVKKKRDVLQPGKLYSLSKLQSMLGKKYKMPMEKSLEVLQKLYEDGYVTYPRTNSEYLATAEQGKMKKIIEGVSKLGYPVQFRFSKTIFDDKKIESHSALTPTYKIPDVKSLTEDEKKVYSAIFRRFVAVFCAEECKVDKTTITIAVGELEEFTLKGMMIAEPGWTKYDDYDKKDKVLPSLNKGDTVNICFKPQEKETTPPKHYTIETLNNYLKNPFREEKAAAETENDEEEYRAVFEGLELGTEATRTSIIDNAKKSGYIELKKDVYRILPGGEFLIESLIRMGISMDKYKTAELGKALKKVFRGEIEVKDSVKIAEDEIAAVFEHKNLPTDSDDGIMGDIAGRCPLCGGEVRRTTFGYGCANYREKGCKFGFRNVICKRTISIENARLLLSEGKTALIKGFISKAGKPFDAFLTLKDGEVKFEFPPRGY